MVETERTRKHMAYCKTKLMLKRTLPILFLVLVRAHATSRILSLYV
jgi:hypothetical protein